MGLASRAQALALVALVVFGVVGAAHARSVEVYKARHRTAQELLPIAQAAIEGEGSAVVDAGTNSVLLIGSETAVARTLELLALQDRARTVFQIRHGWHLASELERLGYAFVWHSAAGRYRAGRLRVAAESTSGRGRLALGAEVRVLDGETAQIGGGESRAVPIEQVDREGRVVRGTEFVSATTGFRVRPTLLSDDRVRLELESTREQFRGGGAAAPIEGSGSVTRVEVPIGETAVVGGIDRTGQRASGFYEATRSEELLVIQVERAD